MAQTNWVTFKVDGEDRVCTEGDCDFRFTVTHSFDDLETMQAHVAESHGPVES